MSQNILCKHGQEQENKAFTGEELEVEVGRSKYVPLLAKTDSMNVSAHSISKKTV
jgi:hypothetical protein